MKLNKEKLFAECLIEANLSSEQIERVTSLYNSKSRTEESYHPEPAEGCTCGFMAQVTSPECPICN